MTDFPYNRDVDAQHQRRARGISRSAPGRVSRSVAEAVAAKLLDHLGPACERIAIAGSVRRGADTVKDLELVAEPTIARNLFGEPDVEIATALDGVVADLIGAGSLGLRELADGGTRNGRKYKALVAVRTGLAIDLFLVVPPATWGAALTIRTGPSDFSARMVTQLRERGMRCEGLRVLRDDGSVMPTPDERSFFEACGEPYVEPWERR